jgi:hypothetical protein
VGRLVGVNKEFADKYMAVAVMELQRGGGATWDLSRVDKPCLMRLVGDRLRRWRLADPLPLDAATALLLSSKVSIARHHQNPHGDTVDFHVP